MRRYLSDEECFNVYYGRAAPFPIPVRSSYIYGLTKIQHHYSLTNAFQWVFFRIKPIARLILKREILGSHTISDQSLLLSTNVLNDWQVFFRQVKETNEITNFQACFFYNVLPNRLTHCYSSSLLASVLLSRIFPTNERVCLNMRRLCFVDNWLHDPISKN